MIHRLFLLSALLFVISVANSLEAIPQTPAYCDNSGSPNGKRDPGVHNCTCEMTTTKDCDAKPKSNMPGCKKDCEPDACKCRPEKCS